MRAFKAHNCWYIVLLLISLPVVLTLASIAASFVSADTDAIKHIARYILPGSAANSIALTLGVCLLAGLLGVGLAWLTAVCSFPLRRFFSWALFLPMAIPGYVMAFAFVGLFEYTGPVQSSLRDLGLSWFPDIYSYGGVVLVLALVLYPYVYLLAKNAFQTMGRNSLEVGQSLGLSRRRSFFRVVLPMARPWIVGGLLLVAMETLADFGTVAVFNYDTLTTAIYKAWFSLYSISSALQIAAVLLLIVVVVTFFERRNRRMQRYASGRNTTGYSKRIVLHGTERILALIVCTTVFVLAFLLPVLQLLVWAVVNLEQELTPRFWSYVYGTLFLAAVAALIVVSIAVLLAFIARMRSSMLVGMAVRTSTLGYALPGAVLAIGLYVPISYVDKSLYLIGIQPGLLQGTLLVMMLAYSVRFMAVAYAPLENNFLRVTPSVDLASRSLGVSGLRMLFRVHLPLIKTGLLTSLVLVFVDVMKELPITLMTRPFGFNTLSVRVFELTSEGMWQRAALPALAIVLVGLVPVIFLIRKTDIEQ